MSARLATMLLLEGDSLPEVVRRAQALNVGEYMTAFRVKASRGTAYLHDYVELLQKTTPLSIGRNDQCMFGYRMPQPVYGADERELQIFRRRA